MSWLTLVRHGQAAAFTANSDQLTDLGARQAQALAQYWSSRQVGFDEVYTGTLERQIATERIVGEAMRSAGLAWPEPVRDAGWNEYDAGGITGKLAPVLAERDPVFAALADDFQRNAQARDRNRYFQRMFEALMESWVRGEVQAPGVEPFDAFHARVRRARDAVLAPPGVTPDVKPATRRVAVFTSGGPIGVCVQLAVEAPPPSAVQLNWRVKNASLTEIVFSSLQRLSLDNFNTLPHLDDPALQSFR
jgi:broad specificity phosphatase PhoE